MRWIAMGMVLVALSASAMTNEEARRQTEQAQAAAQNGLRAVSTVEAQLAAAGRELADVRRRQRDLPGLIDQNNQAMARSRDRLDKLAEIIPTYRATAETAQNAIAKLQPDLAAAQKQAALAQGQVEAVRGKLWKDFTATGPYAEAQAKQTAAAKQYHDAAEACLAEFAKTENYKACQAEIEQKESAVKDLRAANAEQPKIAEASTLWMNSKSREEAMKQSALAADTKVAALQKNLTDCNGALTALKSAFDKDALNQPEYAAAVASLEQEKKFATEAAVKMKTSQSQLTIAQADLRQATTEEGNNKTNFDRAARELTRLNRLLTDVNADLTTADRKVLDSQQELAKAQQDRDRLVGVLKRMQEQEDRVRRENRR